MAINKRLIKSNEGGAAVPTSFNTVLYTGNGGTNAVTGVGFAPDLVWAKGRSVAYNQWVYDTVRGANAGLLPNLTNSENTTPGVLSSLDSDGFTLGSNGELNQNNATYVAWNFKAGGSAVTNTDGTITSQVSANTEAGFSIVSYTGTGANATIGHGLGTAPSMIIVKNRDNAAQLWSVYHASTGAGQVAHLNTTDAFSASGDWQSTTPDSNVYYTNNSPRTNELNKKIIAYCLAEVEGFSNFGSYVGAGYPSTVSVVTGFEPAFVMIKASNLDRNWVMVDNKRGYGNSLSANTSLEEYLTANGQGQEVEFLENGFKVNANSSWTNNSGTSYIYMAFANQF
jgi:hypothetical protein